MSAGPDKVVLLFEGKEVTTAIGEFSADDQKYLRQWMAENRGIYDWPQLRGNGFDGATVEQLGLGAPSVRWRASVGAGDAAVVIGDSKAFTMGVRGGSVVISALGAEDGSELWQKSYKSGKADARVTTTPTVDPIGQRLFTVGPDGRIDCWQLGDGGNIWATPLPLAYSDSKLAVAGVFGSPVLSGDQVLMEIGGPACSLVGLAAANGLEKWRIGKHRSLGTTPVIAEIGQRRVAVLRNEYGLVGRYVEAGTMAWDHSWPSVGRASPLVLGNERVFVTSQEKCAVFKIDGNRTQLLWENSALCSALVTPVFHAGHLYGFNGDALTCVDAESGKVAWTKDGFGAGNLIRATDQLLIQTGSSGELVIADADPNEYKELSRTKVFDGKSSTIPVFATGRIYCRSAAGHVTCLDLRAKKSP